MTVSHQQDDPFPVFVTGDDSPPGPGDPKTPVEPGLALSVPPFFGHHLIRGRGSVPGRCACRSDQIFVKGNSPSWEAQVRVFNLGEARTAAAIAWPVVWFDKADGTPTAEVYSPTFFSLPGAVIGGTAPYHDLHMSWNSPHSPTHVFVVVEDKLKDPLRRNEPPWNLIAAARAGKQEVVDLWSSRQMVCRSLQPQYAFSVLQDANGLAEINLNVATTLEFELVAIGGGVSQHGDLILKQSGRADDVVVQHAWTPHLFKRFSSKKTSRGPAIFVVNQTLTPGRYLQSDTRHAAVAVAQDNISDGLMPSGDGNILQIVWEDSFNHLPIIPSDTTGNTKYAPGRHLRLSSRSTRRRRRSAPRARPTQWANPTHRILSSESSISPTNTDAIAAFVNTFLICPDSTDVRSPISPI